MSFWLNLVGYQLVWFIAVIAAGHGRVWPGVAAATLFVVAYLSASTRRRLDVSLVTIALLSGVCIDGALALSGLLRYAADSPALPPGGAPLWILALWAVFALTLTRSLAWLQRARWFAMLLGAIGAPLAYLGAARGWQAVQFAAPAWRAQLLLGLGWAAAMALLLRVIAASDLSRARSQ
jgi:hypothetical protein